MERLRLFIITIFSLFPLYSSAQIILADQRFQENVRLETNTKLIFSGQDLLYRATVLSNNANHNLSKIAYVSLIDETGKTWFLDKITTNPDNIGSGSFTIPTEAQTGNYKLFAYTLWSKNNKKAAYYIQDLIIINPFIPLAQKNLVKSSTYNIIQRDTLKKFVGKWNTPPLKIQLDQQTYNTREKVLLTVEYINSTFNGNYSISVSQVPQGMPNKEIEASFLDQKEKREIYPPEIKGELLSGSIVSNKASANLYNQLISLSIPDSKSIFKLTQTNEDGRFIFLLDQQYDTSQAILQVVGKSAEYTISIDKKTPEPAKELSFKEIKIDPALKNWITEESIGLQIENAYKELSDTDSTYNGENPKFYDPFATRYILDDYTRFPSMHETFIEVIELAALRKDSDQVRMRIYNPNSVIESELDKLAPLVLIDGIQIQDFSLVANLNPVRVSYIDVVAQQYRYGPKIFSGIIALSTKKNDFKLPENSPNTLNFELKSPEENNDFRVKNSRNPTISSRIPDYRTQLYWNPYLKITNEPQEITFYTSDKEGLFEICITGYKASGEKIEVKKTFRVKAGEQ